VAARAFRPRPRLLAYLANRLKPSNPHLAKAPRPDSGSRRCRESAHHRQPELARPRTRRCVDGDKWRRVHVA